MKQAQLIIETDRLAKMKTSHILHLILSIVTVGWWIPVWIIIGLNTVIERGRIEKRIKKLAENNVTIEIDREFPASEQVKNLVDSINKESQDNPLKID